MIRHDDIPLLNASLRTLVLPLDVDVPRKTPVVTASGLDAPEVFMAAQWRKVDEWSRHHSARLEKAGITASGHVGDTGFGVPHLLASRTFEHASGAELHFGASENTLLERGQEDAYWTMRPTTCVSLWHTTQGIPVLTVERLAPLTEDDGLTGEYGSPVDLDLLAVLPELLEGTGLALDFSLDDVFGTRLPELRLTPEDARTRPVRKMRVESTDLIRGRGVTEGFYCVTAPGASDLAAQLVKGLLRETEADQDSGAPSTWEPLELVDEPAEPGATGAIRDDSRAALVNLEALSIHHEYYGFGGGGMLATALPYIAHRAVAERDLARLLHDLQDTDSKASVKDALVDLDSVRMAAFRRRHAYRVNKGERFRAWTVPTHLATSLLTRTCARMDEQDRHAGEIASVLAARLEQKREARRQRVDNVIKVLSPVAGVAVLVGVYEAIATLPADSTESMLEAIPDAALATLVVIGVGLLAGGLMRLLERR